MKAKYFKIEELVSEKVLNELGEELCWGLIDERLIKTLDSIREHFGKPIVVNNWKNKGDYKDRGFRSETSTGAKYSQHKFGRAVDFDVVGLTAREVRTNIMKNIEKFPFLKRMEDDVNWVHIDVANTNSPNIVLFKQ